MPKPPAPSNSPHSSQQLKVKSSKTDLSSSIGYHPAAQPPKPIAPSHISSRDQLPESLTKTLDHIVKQLDVLTKTISIMDERLTMTEDRVAKLIASQKTSSENT